MAPISHQVIKPLIIRSERGLPMIYFKFYTDINAAIREFNESSTPENRISALKKIQAAIEYVDLHASPSLLAQSDWFHRVKNVYFEQIKQAYAENGVETMLPVGKADSPVAHIIADMALSKADRLMEILHKGSSSTLFHDLGVLYDSSDTSIEAKRWRAFLSQHSIEFLGGSNSKNFKVTNLSSGQIKVLKVDNRFDMPRHVEQHLRVALGDILTPVDIARQVRGFDPRHQIVSRTLLVTDFCTLGSALEHSDKISKIGQIEIYSAVSHIMGQMALAFMDIQKADCCFPDAKLMNWLVGADGTLHVADTKSFLFTRRGVYQQIIPGNEGLGILFTHEFRPKELTNASFDAEKLHASLLGHNIYNYMTGERPNLSKFYHPVFLNEIGKEYKQLISQLTLDPPASRMSLKDAYAELQRLGIKSDFQKALQGDATLATKYDEYGKLKEKFSDLKFGKKDPQMLDFLTRCDQEIMKTGQPYLVLMQAQMDKMNGLLRGLGSPENRKIADLINKFDIGKRWYTIGMAKKARHIEVAMGNVPIEDRAQLLQSKHPTVTKLLQAIASHRKSYIDPMNAEGKIKENSSANAFQEYRAAFKAQIDAREDVEHDQKTTVSPKKP